MLAGQTAVVTGGGRGLGRAFALGLAAAGASVAVVARSEHQLSETVAAISEAGGLATSVAGDVSDPFTVGNLAAEIESRLGHVDLLINNAGIGTPFGPVSDVDPGEWWRSVEINLRSPFLCSRAFLPGMAARQRGRIVNVASGAGTMSIPYLSSYIVAKAALIRFSEILAAEARNQGISVFAIEPGTVRTAMASTALESEAGRKWLPWFGKLFEEGRDVPPDLAVKLVIRLASGAADSLSGRFITISDDIDAMIGKADEIRRQDLYTLRLRTERDNTRS